MAEVPDGGGSSGGGSTTSICTINPSDNVAIINNLISRISDIEKFLSQLVGADVHADNLSELAANIGNILNGTITLPSDGNSPYGVGGSIPIPDGFSGTVISGNVITTWTDGVVSFQVIPGSGVTAGASNTKVDYFSGADTITYSTITSIKVFKNFFQSQYEGLITQNITSGKLSFATTGLYLIGYVISVDYPSGAGSNKRLQHGFGSSSGWYSNLSQIESISETGLYSFSGSYLFRNTGSPNDLYLQVNDSGVAGNNRVADCPSLFIIKLKGL